MRKTRKVFGVRRAKGFAVVLIFAGLGQAAWAGSLQWTPLGPEGGWAVSLATAPGRAGTAVVGMAGAGVWQTTDAARHWTRLPLPPNPDEQYGVPTHYQVTLDPADPGTIYVTAPSSLWSSHDGGAHWVRKAFASPISAFAMAPSNPRVLYVSGTSPGPGVAPTPIYRSADGGATWRQSDTRIVLQPDALVVDPVDPKILYFAGHSFSALPNGRFASSHDGGLTWKVLSKRPSLDTKLVLQPGSRSVFYSCSTRGVSRSSDGGHTWSTLLAVDNNRCDLALDPSTPGTLYAVTNNLFAFPPVATLRKSRNGGLTWETIRTVADHVDTLAVDSRLPARLYAGLGKAGVLKSEDGGAHWTVQSTGLLATSVSDVAVDPAHPGTLLAAAEGGIFRSLNGGMSWTAVGKGLPADAGVLRIVASPTAPGVFYAGAEAGFFRSLDGGESWQAGAHLPMTSVLDVAVDADLPNRLYAAGVTFTTASPRPPNLPVLAVSEDGGASWSLPRQVPNVVVLSSLAVDPADPAHLYAGGDTLVTSHDHGDTWTDLGPGYRGPFLEKVVTDPRSAQTLFEVWDYDPSKILVKSSDQGRTFIAIDAGLPRGIAVRDLVLDPRSSSILYAATSRGVFVSRDGGASWALDNLGMGPVPVVSLTIDPLAPGMLYAGTGRGVYATPIQ